MSPVWHQQRASVTSVPIELDLQRCGRRNGGHRADVHPLCLQQRSLLDVKLQEVVVPALGHQRQAQQVGQGAGAGVAGGLGGLQTSGGARG